MATTAPFSPSQYLCPAQSASEDAKLGWLREANQTANDYLKSQKGYEDIDEAVSILSSEEQSAGSAHISSLSMNLAKQNIEDVVSTLSNIRMIGEVRTDSRKLDQQVRVINKMQTAWYQSTMADRKIRRALQYAAAGGVGYVMTQWKRDFWTSGRGDIDLAVLGPRDVLPFQIGSDHDLQRAYSVTVKHEMSLAEAVSRYPDYTDAILATKQQASWIGKGLSRVQKFLSPVLNAGYRDRHPEDAEPQYPVVNVRYTYVMDPSVNEQSVTVPMGTPGTKWYYEVPAIGSDIKTGLYDAQGNELTRKARYEDCLLYPLRRLIISIEESRIVYDGPSYWWHGRVPVIPFRLNDWPWTYLGFSLVRDVKSAQTAMTRTMRALDDSAQARLDPPTAYNASVISKATAERINPRSAGWRVMMDQSGVDTIKPLIPAEYYNIPPYVLEFVKFVGEYIPSAIGSRDFAALAKAGKVPAGDTMEKLMEMSGPRTTDKSRNMEAAIVELSRQWCGLAFEFYDLPRRVQILGPDGVGEHDYDYDPGNMIPSHLPDEYELIQQGKMGADAPSRAGLVERARRHVESFYVTVKPHTLHQITQMSNRLMMMQLFIRGFPIDPWTVAESMDIANFGRPPEGFQDTVFGRWLGWKKLLAELGGKQPAPKGRKPTGQTPPTQTTKAGGRPIIRESPR